MTGDQAAAPVELPEPCASPCTRAQLCTYPLCALPAVTGDQAAAPAAPRRQTRPGLPEPLVGCLLAAAASALVALAGAAGFILILTH